MKVDEAIRTVRLKLEVRKQNIWSPGMVFSAEIQEVETLIAEVERLRSQVADLRDQLTLARLLLLDISQNVTDPLMVNPIKEFLSVPMPTADTEVKP